MRLMKSLLVAATLAFAVPAFAGDPAPAPKSDAPKADKKCDKAGKECKDGADCKAENCKK